MHEFFDYEFANKEQFLSWIANVSRDIEELNAARMQNNGYHVWGLWV